MSKRKPPAKKSPDSLMGWLGRQVGHVKKAVHTDVTRPARRPSGKSAAAPKPPAAAPAAAPPPAATVLYREDKIEEADLPDRPGVKLRRTIIDEVIVEKKGE